MKLGIRHVGLVFLSVSPGLFLTAQLAIGRKQDKTTTAAQSDRRRQAVHALSRLTFGPRPGDVEHVIAMGIDKWIDQQLHPDKIDDHALDARLSPFRTLRMDTREIVENFPPEQVIKAVADGKRSLPSDPLKRAVYQAQLDRYQDKEDRKQASANSASGKAGNLGDDERARREQEVGDDGQTVEELLDLPPDQRMKAI